MPGHSRGHPRYIDRRVGELIGLAGCGATGGTGGTVGTVGTVGTDEFTTVNISGADERLWMVHHSSTDIPVRDAWDTIAEGVREDFLAQRMGMTDPSAFERRSHDGERWVPLRPVVLQDRAYRFLEAIVARLMELAVQSCQRRASTLGELHQVLRFRDDLPLMDPDGPLVASDLTACVRPDLLIERGRPRIVEFNVGTRIGGGTNAPRMAQAFAQLAPQSGLYPPASTVTARTQAMVRVLGDNIGVGADNPRRLAIPAYWTTDETGTRRHNKKVKRPILASVERAGFEVVRPDLDQLRLDSAGRLRAVDELVDLVLVQWGCGETRHFLDGHDGLAALRDADRAGTVQVFPRTESALLNSKAILAWLHEDSDADLLSCADAALVRAHIPRTTALGLDRASSAPGDTAARGILDERDHMIVKPAVGKAGNGMRFGSQTTAQDWHRAVVDAAREAPVVAQEKVEPDRITMPFLDRTSGQQVTAQVPFLLSPFLIDGVAADVSVRHMTPEVPAGDVIIGVDRGGCWNTVVLLPDPNPTH